MPLAGRGYRVQLVDPVPLHVEQARQAAACGPVASYAAALGDARELPAAAQSQDAVLLFAPLYQLTGLTGLAGRPRALAEAGRVLRPGGRLLAVAISRFASAARRAAPGLAGRPGLPADRGTGPGRRPAPQSHPAARLEFFTTAYYHTPDGLAGEVRQAGFTGPAVYGTEGPGWPLLQDGADPPRREQILFAARSVETQPALLGFSLHLLAAAAKA